MPTVKELNIQLENRPGTLAKLCNALANRKVNIIAFQASTEERRSQIHLVVDNPTTAKTVLSSEGLTYTETEVAQITLQNRPGVLARVAGRLGDANININYAYSGIDPSNNAVLFFGVSEVGRAAQLLDQAAATAAG